MILTCINFHWCKTKTANSEKRKTQKGKERLRGKKEALETSKKGKTNGKIKRKIKRKMKKGMTRIITIVFICALVASCFLQGCAQKDGNSTSQGQENAEQGMTDDNNKNGSRSGSAAGANTDAEKNNTAKGNISVNKDTQAGTGGTSDAAGHAGSASTAAPSSGTPDSSTASTAGSAATEKTSTKKDSTLSPEMSALDKKLREELENKSGVWSLYLYRLDTDEEIAINADQPMVSASLIKLYIAGCYLERVKKGKLDDNYDYQLFKMLSESDNGATNTLIDVLGMDRINRFMKKHHFKAGKLNRKMLVQNGTENYTSSADCGKVLREVYNWDYVNPDSSARVMRALWAQIPRNRQKIPAGVPSDIETANKTGELYTHDQNGTGITVQNDAAVIFAPHHPYILVVMTAVPGGGEGQLHREIAGLSAQVYEAICGTKEEESETGESAISGGTAQSGEGAAAGSTGNK